MVRKLTFKGDGFDKDGNHVVFTITTQTIFKKEFSENENDFGPLAKALGISKVKAKRTEVFLP